MCLCLSRELMARLSVWSGATSLEMPKMGRRRTGAFTRPTRIKGRPMSGRTLLAVLCATSFWPAQALEAHAGGRLLVAHDVIQIRVLDDPDLTMGARVEADGTIAFPYIGRIKAAGLTEDALAQIIERRLVDRHILAPP